MTVGYSFATDLALWQPATPLAAEKAAAQSMFYSCVGMLQPAVTAEEKFRLCKSVLREGKTHLHSFLFRLFNVIGFLLSRRV